MKLQDFLIPFFLAVLTTWAIFRFFLAPTAPAGSLQAGQSFKAPTEIEINVPLKTTLPTVDKPNQIQETNIDTEYGTFLFSTDGAVLKNYIFKRTISGELQEIPIIEHSEEQKPDAFYLAFESQGLRNYSLRNAIKESDKTIIEYEGRTTEVTVYKKFIVSHAIPQIDLVITIEPQNNKKIQPRLFLPAPFIKNVEYNAPLGIVFAPNQSIEKTRTNLLAHQFWAVPTLFGAENRYFVTASVRDDGFTQRGYYMGESAPETLTTIFEGPLISAKKTWNFTFYCGPKDSTYFAQVDPRLEGTLDYGWLAPLVKIMLVILKFLYMFVRNYGWAIIFLTLLLRLLQVPFTMKSQKMVEQQKEFQQKMRYIEQKYQNDPQTLYAERMVLTKKYSMSGFKNTLPQLLQIPFIFALNRALSSSFELYHAPFIGWIHDLSARDPYYILPLLAGVGILVQSMTSSDMRAGISMLLFAAIVVAITANLAAGLALYLCVSTWLGIAFLYVQKRFKFS